MKAPDTIIVEAWRMERADKKRCNTIELIKTEVLDESSSVIKERLTYLHLENKAHYVIETGRIKNRKRYNGQRRITLEKKNK